MRETVVTGPTATLEFSAQSSLGVRIHRLRQRLRKLVRNEAVAGTVRTVEEPEAELACPLGLFRRR